MANLAIHPVPAPSVPAVPALSTLVMQRPELKRCGTGLVCSLFANAVWLITPDARCVSKYPDLDLALVQATWQWVDQLQGIGIAALLMMAEFTDEPVPQESLVMTPLDVAALHAAMAEALQGTELDPKWLCSVIRLARRAPGEPIRVESVLASQVAGEQVQHRLVRAIESWLAPRRRWFVGVNRLHLDLDHWAAAEGMQTEVSESEAALMWMPVAGTA